MRKPALNSMFVGSHVSVAAGAVRGSDWVAQTKRTRIRAGGLSTAGGKFPE